MKKLLAVIGFLALLGLVYLYLEPGIERNYSDMNQDYLFYTMFLAPIFMILIQRKSKITILLGVILLIISFSLYATYEGIFDIITTLSLQGESLRMYLNISHSVEMFTYVVIALLGVLTFYKKSFMSNAMLLLGIANLALLYFSFKLEADYFYSAFHERAYLINEFFQAVVSDSAVDFIIIAGKIVLTTTPALFLFLNLAGRPKEKRS